jgi:hypothetical protein
MEVEGTAAGMGLEGMDQDVRDDGLLKLCMVCLHVMTSQLAKCMFPL